MVANFENLIHHMNTLQDDYAVEQLEHYVCSINSYLGLMRHTNSYDIRKRIMSKMDRKFYKHLYIKGNYECVRIKRKFKRDVIVRRKLRDKRNFEYLLDNYDERQGYDKGKGNSQTA